MKPNASASFGSAYLKSLAYSLHGSLSNSALLKTFKKQKKTKNFIPME